MNINLIKEDIYSTRIWIAKLDFEQSDYQLMINTVCEIKENHPVPRGRSNRGGWNSEPIIIDHPNFLRLREQVITVFNLAINEMGGANINYRLKGWANVLEDSSFNNLHVHPGSILSGVFYLQAPEGSSELGFRDPRPGVVLGTLRGGEANSYIERNVKPKQGMLVVFPGWLDHKVEINMSKTPRISIAINADPVIG